MGIKPGEEEFSLDKMGENKSCKSKGWFRISGHVKLQSNPRCKARVENHAVPKLTGGKSFER